MENKFTIYLGPECNLDCVMCNIKGVDELNNETDYDEMVRVLNKRKDEGKYVGFTGGEPTTHPKIEDLVEQVYSLGYKGTVMSSNGLRFTDENFTKSLAEKGLFHVCVSLHGTQRVHNKITGQKSYKRAIEGVSNLKKYGVGVSLSSVLQRMNVNNLNRFYQDVLDMGIKSVTLLDVDYSGKAIKNFKELNIPSRKKKSFFIKNIDLIKKFDKFAVHNFNPCVIPRDCWEDVKQVPRFYKNLFFKFECGLKGPTPKNPNRVQVEVCNNCMLSEICSGFLKKSIEINGKDDVEEMLAV